MRHDLALAAKRPDGQAAADDLTKAGEIRHHAEDLLRPASAGAEAADDLVEDEHSAVFAGDFAQAFEEALFRHDQAHVAWDRLNDDRSDLRWMLLKEGAHTRQIVVLGHQRFLGHICWHTRARWHTEGHGAAARVDQQMIGVAVVAAFKFHDQIAPGVAARQTQRAHRRLRAGGDHAHHLHRWDQLADQRRHLSFQLRRHAKGRAVFKSLLDRSHNRWMAVSQDQRTPGADHIHIGLTVDVDDVGTFAVLHEDRCLADSLEGAHWAVDAARDDLLSAGKSSFGFFKCVAHDQFSFNQFPISIA